ncbi:MAG: hypothetical protein J6Z31_01155 [Fibrobacter sp.]|nr:hypothetical protein [Fibrobacter sp.]
MTLAERIQKLLSEAEQGLIERESILRLLYLAVLTRQSTYLYGRAGSGKRSVVRHMLAGFKNLDVRTFGRRSFNLPTDPANIILFTSFDSGFPPMTSAIHAVIDEHLAHELILSGRLRPDASLSQAGLSDNIHLVISFPDSVSPNALKDLLSDAGDPKNFHISDDLKISSEEMETWSEEIEKIQISDDSLIILKAIAAECERSNVYISARRWRGLAKMARAQAFFAGRSETNISDLLFLSEDLWGKRATSEAIRKGYSDGMHDFLNAYAPDPENLRKKTQELLISAEHYKNASGNRYKTTTINGEEYICYSITVFNEPISLYAPLSRIGTNEDFHPLNALHHTETRAKCNFMGGDVCKISIDSKAKRNGMRASSIMQSNTNTSSVAAVYEDYAKLPSEILQTNDPEIIEQNKLGLQSAHEKLYEVITQTLQSLKSLKALYTKSSEFQNDPFLPMRPYKSFMDLILKRYKALSAFSKELQQYEAAIAQASTGIQ